jgi:hypothetical protein
MLPTKDMSAEDRRERWIDILSALLLAMATVLAAWSAFQSAKWSGLQAISFAEGNSARQESVRASTRAGQERIVDVQVFIEFIDAVNADDLKLADFYRDRMREEFKPALDAWLESEPLKNPDALPTPFAEPEYVLASETEATRLEEVAAGKFQQALDDNQRSDNYVLLAVLFASVLLFAGLAPKSRRYSLQVTMLALAGFTLVVGVTFLATFPKVI